MFKTGLLAFMHGKARAEPLRNPRGIWCSSEHNVTPCPLCLPSTGWCSMLAPHTRLFTSTDGLWTRRMAPASSPRLKPAPCPVSVPTCVCPWVRNLTASYLSSWSQWLCINSQHGMLDVQSLLLLPCNCFLDFSSNNSSSQLLS